MYVIYWIDGYVYVSDGLCMYEQVYFVDGFVMDYVIECLKYNGCFDVCDGWLLLVFVCEKLCMYCVKIEDGCILIEV